MPRIPTTIYVLLIIVWSSWITSFLSNPSIQKFFQFYRLAAEFRECQRNGSQEYLENRWRREIEFPITDENLQCLIEPIKIHELTMTFFQREHMHLNGSSSITRSSSGASISSRSSYAAPVVAPTIPRKSQTPPAAIPPSTNETYSRRLSTSFLSEIHKLTVPPPPDSLKQLGSHFKPAIMVNNLFELCIKTILWDLDIRTNRILRPQWCLLTFIT